MLTSKLSEFAHLVTDHDNGILLHRLLHVTKEFKAVVHSVHRDIVPVFLPRGISAHLLLDQGSSLVLHGLGHIWPDLQTKESARYSLDVHCCFGSNLYD